MVQSGQKSNLAQSPQSTGASRAKSASVRTHARARLGLLWHVRTATLLASIAGLGVVAGCENDSYMSPSVGLGRFEHTPTTAPILDRLAAVEGPAEGSGSAPASEILPEDLIPEVDAYRLGAGDQLTIDVTDLIRPDVTERYERVVDPRGFVDLPKVPSIFVDGLNAEEVKAVVAEAYRARGILTNTTVDVNITQRRRLTYNVMGGVTNPGTYSIPRPEFRLLEALTQAGRFNEEVQWVYVIRGVPLSDRAAGRFRPQVGNEDGSRVQPPPVGMDPLMIPAPAATPGATPTDQLPVPAKRESVVDLIDSLGGQTPGQPAQPAQPQPTQPQQPANPGLAPAIAPGMMPSRRQPTSDNRAPAPVIDIDSVNRAPQAAQQAPGTLQQAPQAPQPTQTQFYRSPNASRWQFIDGQWINTAGTVQDTSSVTTTTGPGAAMGVPQPRRSGSGAGAAEGVLRQRVIKVPMQALIQGSPQYNIVIRPFDIVRIPSQREGQVYVEGQVQRPGVYNLPPYGQLTLTRAIVAAGGLNEIAIPERVDITRFVGSDRQATVRVNLRAMKEGTHPDIYLREGDLVNVGTNFWAFPLSIIRQGFRFSYGFGFSLDRNFGFDVFGPLQTTDL